MSDDKCATKVDGKMKIGREKYWSELTTDEKIKRMRDVVKGLGHDNNILQQRIHRLEKHSHKSDGTMVIPFNHSNDIDRYYSPLHQAIKQIKDEVYF